MYINRYLRQAKDSSDGTLHPANWTGRCIHRRIPNLEDVPRRRPGQSPLESWSTLIRNPDLLIEELDPCYLRLFSIVPEHAAMAGSLARDRVKISKTGLAAVARREMFIWQFTQPVRSLGCVCDCWGMGA